MDFAGFGIGGSFEKADMDELFREIQKKSYSTLILDARGRKNLQLVSAALLSNHLAPKPADWGVYLTRKWLDSSSAVPKPSEYNRNLKNATAIAENNFSLYTEKGFYLKPDPAASLFHGKIYLLVDNRTSRLAEALAIWLKSDKLGLDLYKNKNRISKLFNMSMFRVASHFLSFDMRFAKSTCFSAFGQ